VFRRAHAYALPAVRECGLTDSPAEPLGFLNWSGRTDLAFGAALRELQSLVKAVNRPELVGAKRERRRRRITQQIEPGPFIARFLGAVGIRVPRDRAQRGELSNLQGGRGPQDARAIIGAD